MSKTPSILAIDQGTTGSTCLVLSANGRVLGRAYSEFTQHFPRPGWVEHDPQEIWDVTRRVAREALRAAANADVRGIGITNQRETVVLWDPETLEPVHRAIVWQDRRTADLCRELQEAGHGPEVRRRTGLVLDPYFSGTKLRWLLREHPGLRTRAEAGELVAGTIDTWLVARMTGGDVYATDPTNASRTLLYSLSDASWDPWLLDLLGVPPSLLPEIRASSGDFGVSRGDCLGIEAPVAGVAGDQQAALFGQGCWSSGLAKNTYGTGAFLLMHTGDRIVPSSHGLLTTAACGPEGGLAFALEGSVFVAGAAVQWLRDRLGILEHAAESERMAAGLETNDGVYFVPHSWVSDHRIGCPGRAERFSGSRAGPRRSISSGAALEAMAYATREVIGAMEADSSVAMRELRVDGGAANNDWLMRFQAGVLGVPVKRPGLVETTALGAAALAGLATGVWSSGDDFLAVQAEGERFDPDMEDSARDELLGGWARAIAALRHWSDEGREAF